MDAVARILPLQFPFFFPEFWKNRSETNNFYQRHEVELIKEEKRKIVELEVRLKVKLLRVITLSCDLTSLASRSFCLAATVVTFAPRLCQVDEQMRKELAEWKLNVDKDKGKGGKKGKGKVICDSLITR